MIAPFADKYVFRTETGYRIVSYVTADNQDAVHSLLDGEDGDAFVFSGGDVGRQLVEMLRGSFNYIGAVCGVVVFVFLLLSFLESCGYLDRAALLFERLFDLLALCRQMEQFGTAVKFARLLVHEPIADQLLQGHGQCLGRYVLLHGGGFCDFSRSPDRQEG